MSVVYRFADTWDLIIVPNKDMSVTFIFWELIDGIPTRLIGYGTDVCEPLYRERFG